MAVLFQLIVAHLLADFVFQTNKVVEQKEANIYGHVNHAVIVCFWTAVFVFPYWGTISGWFVVVMATLLHFIQDLGKILLEKTLPDKFIPYLFIGDQVFHIGFLLGLGFFLMQATPIELFPQFLALYTNTAIPFFVVILISITFAYDIAIYQFSRVKTPALPYKRNYKKIGLRGLSFSIFFGLFIFIFSSLNF